MLIEFLWGGGGGGGGANDPGLDSSDGCTTL